MHRGSLFFLSSALSFALLACTSGSLHSGEPDATVSPAIDAGGAPSDAACPRPLAPYCADGGLCPDYDAAIHPSGALCGGAAVVKQVCGSETLVTLGYLDTSQTFVFDTATLQLVAVQESVDLESSCLAGPPSFTLPTSCEGAADYSPGCTYCGPDDNRAYGWPVIVTPVHAPAASCTDEQIDAYYSCFPQLGNDAGAACDRFGPQGTASDQACAACLVPDDAGITGALGRTYFQLIPTNTWGCIAEETGDASTGSCAGAYAAALACALDACVSRCMNVPEGPSFDCVSLALAGSCAPLLAEATCVARDGGIADTCGIYASAEDQFRAVARVFCESPADAGSPAIDGGTLDGG